jgi:hypothetical protein
VKRRSFFGALASAVAAPAVPHRVYSFLWDNPLVVIPDEYEIRVGGYYQLMMMEPSVLKRLYPQNFADILLGRGDVKPLAITIER